jgi:hypothetical protein
MFPTRLLAKHISAVIFQPASLCSLTALSRAGYNSMFAWLEQRLHETSVISDDWDGINVFAGFRQPATAEVLARCEADLGRPLPESFRAFLELHDGGFIGAEVALKFDPPQSAFRYSARRSMRPPRVGS